MSGEISCIVMKERCFEALYDALIVLKYGCGVTNWISNTGRKVADVDNLLDAARKRNDFGASGMSWIAS
jgi:hypothetical protein